MMGACIPYITFEHSATAHVVLLGIEVGVMPGPKELNAKPTSPGQNPLYSNP